MTTTYPMQVTCQREACTWTHEAQDQDDAIDAWEAHVHTGCPQRAEVDKPSTNGPSDPLGTVRASTGVLAVRAHSAHPDHDDELVWFVIDVSHQDQTIDVDTIEAQLATWPIVYQP